MIKKENLQDIYPLTPLQEGMLFHSRYDPDSSAYFQQSLSRMTGNLDIEAFQQSWNIIFKRHDVLRTLFVTENVPRPLQFVLKERECDFVYKDIAHLSKSEQETFLLKAGKADRDKGFDLSRDVLMRVTLLQTGANEYYIYWSFHHILMDGWCSGILEKELWYIYSSIKKHIVPDLPASVPYGQYIMWLEKQDKKTAQNYWNSYLDGFNGISALHSDTSFQSDTEYILKREILELNNDESSALYQLASQNMVTVNTVLQSLWGLLLCRHNNVNDAVFGIVASHRPSEINGIESMIGMFINTLPVRIKYDKNSTFKDVLKRNHHDSADRQKHHHCPLSEIQSQNGSKRQLIDHIIVFEPAQTKSSSNKHNPIPEGIEIEKKDSFEQTNYDLEISIATSDVISIRFGFNENRYSREFIKVIANQLHSAILTVLKNEQIQVNDINFIGKDERAFLTNRFNVNRENLPPKTVIELFEEQAGKHSSQTAIIFQEKKISYQELNERVNIIANNLRREYSVRPDDVFGIMIDRSEHMVIAILGILKSGAAYLPLDPNFPADRIKYILENSNCKIVVSEEKYKKLLTGFNMPVMDIAICPDNNISNPGLTTSPDNLAYLIYTSGSTGNPKGVMVSHKNVVSFSSNMSGVFGFKPGDPILALTTISFDISVLELISSLLNGMTVVVSSESEIKNRQTVFDNIEKHRVTAMQITPSHLKLLLAENELHRLNGLKTILIGGEPLPQDLFKRLQPISGKTKIINVYGPTETTIWSSCKVLNDGKLNIGSPLNFEGIAILDSDGNFAPVGAIGEICITGSGVTIGYYGNPRLTAISFIPHPFNKNERVYKSGDLGRMMPDGNIECFGRTDNQVKIRGHRIEPGEIEECLKKHPAVKDAAVICVKSILADNELVAYIIYHNEPETSTLREFSKKNLPGYMVPSFFVSIDKFPLTPNGKVDRVSLSKLDVGIQSAIEPVKPRTDLERKLVVIWEKILGHKEIGINHDFFDLGGHSLKALGIAIEIQKQLKVKIDLRDIFDSTIISELANIIEKKTSVECQPVRLVGRQPYYDLSHGQKRLWMLDKIEKANGVYNMPGAFIAEGDLNISAMNKAFNSIITRHEVLRTVFKEINGEPKQFIHEEIDFHIEEIDLSNDIDPKLKANEIAEKEAMFQFDLSVYPLIRAKLLRLDQNSNILLLNIHHIVCDGLSLEIIEKELFSVYNKLTNNENVTLPQLKLQYKDYAAWHNSMLNSGDMKVHRSYWHDKLSGELEELNLSTDFPRGKFQTYEGSSVYDEWDYELFKEVKEFSAINKGTMFITIIAMLKILLYRFSNNNEIILGAPVSGRCRPDLDDQVGFYVNTIVLRNKINGVIQFKELFQQIKESVVAAHEHQTFPFDLLVNELKPPRKLNRAPFFDVMAVVNVVDTNVQQLHNLKISDFKFESKISKFDMTFEFLVQNDSIKVRLNYNCQLYKPGTVKRLLHHLRILTKSAINNPTIPVNRLAILSRDELQTVIYKNNKINLRDKREYNSIVSRFQKQAQVTPLNVAVISNSRQMTYRELDDKSDNLAYVLKTEYKIGIEDVVGVVMKRSELAIVAIMAIMKAGAVYMPLDTGYPVSRIEFMINDSGCRLLITENDSLLKTKDLEIDCCVITDYENGKNRFNEPCSDIDNLAYIIYTSGSTGKPKGVMVTHRGIINTAYSQIEIFNILENDRVLQFAPETFDASISEVFMALLKGAALVIIDKETIQEPKEFAKYLSDNRVTVATLPPAYLNILNYESIKTLRVLVSAGSPVLKSDAMFYSKYKNFFNAYGPTEISICATCHKVDPEVAYGNAIPIGESIHNASVYILNSALELAPVGVTGEIYIGGEGVARGYLNNVKLTAEKFIPDPFGNGQRLYSTGDLGIRLDDGNIEFTGRIDRQVKIRGCRVEPGEIENALSRCDSIENAIVVCENDSKNDYTITAYYKTDTDKLSATDIKNYLGEELPGYMMPSLVIKVDTFPLTQSGKIDYKKLALLSADKADDRIVGLLNDNEKIVVEIMKKVLNLKKIDKVDNFFQLGGDSLKAINLAADISDKFKVDIDVKEIFDKPTAFEIAEIISIKSGDNVTSEDNAANQNRIDFAEETKLDSSICTTARVDESSFQFKSIFLTGATGFLGVHLLSEFLTNSDATIYCLIRSENQNNTLARLKKQMCDCNVWDDNILDRIIPVNGDLGQPLLGMNEHEFDMIAEKVDFILHNGAIVNFLYPYPILKQANVNGTQEVLRLACRKRTKPVCFISTLSVFTSADNKDREYIDEDYEPGLFINDLSGYAQSKLVSEKLVNEARQLGVPTCVIRPGRITGHSVTGLSNIDDLFSTLLISSLKAGIFPDENVSEDMTPVDFAAKSIIGLSNNKDNFNKTFHLFNPEPVEQDALAEWFNSSGYPVERKSSQDWRTGIIRYMEQNENNKNDTLLHFIKTASYKTKNTKIDNRKTIKVLEGMGIRCPRITKTLIEKYLTDFKNRGFL